MEKTEMLQPIKRFLYNSSAKIIYLLLETIPFKFNLFRREIFNIFHASYSSYAIFIDLGSV